MIIVTDVYLAIKGYSVSVYNLFNLKQTNSIYIEKLIDLYREGEIDKLKENILKPLAKNLITESGMVKRELLVIFPFNKRKLYNRTRKYLTVNTLAKGGMGILTLDKKQIDSYISNNHKVIHYIKESELVDRICENIKEMKIKEEDPPLYDNELIGFISLLVTVWINGTL